MTKFLISVLSLSAVVSISFAAPNKKIKRAEGLNKTAAGCNATTATVDLDVNNVRARLMNGGDMWWDIPSGTAQYEVPKQSKKNSLFAGSIWIGGRERSSNLVFVAAQTYRQRGNDYWAGPLNAATAEVTPEVCSQWDKIWKINAAEITTFRNLYAAYTNVQDIRNSIQGQLSSVPKIIREWPAQGNTEALGAGGQVITNMPNRDMAEYVNVDSLPGYDWRGGDYPKILGDQYLWWVFNDKGDVKQHSGSESMNLEIHASAFAFNTNDCLNDATFNNYRVYTWGSSTIDSTYMATFSDADLGAAFDDFIGCDTTRGLGILYNGDAFDEGNNGYGFDIPMVGIDYFQGPKYKDPNDTTKRIELKMTSFTFFTNGGANGQDDPNTKEEHYNYMTGFWGDGQPFYTSPNARTNNGQVTKFSYTGDPCKGGWSEVLAGNTANDRRFVHSSGPFVMEPGTEPQNITIGAVWVPSVGGGSSACFSKIQICDDKAQKLFEQGFQLPSGPNAPKVNYQPLDGKLVFDIDNEFSSNNFKEGYGTNLSDKKYREVAKEIAVKANNPDSLYKFEGYIVYQLKDASTSISDLRNTNGSLNTDRARIVFQCDKKNGIKEILNFEVDPAVSTDYYLPKRMVEGKDLGIVHSFEITQDAFAVGTSKNLINYKTYYYLVVAYAHNEFSAPKLFDKDRIDSLQETRYLESRTDGKGLPIQVIAAIPHPATDNLYIQNYADYGTGLRLKRIEGIGNGGIPLSFSPESEAAALVPPYHVYQPTYVGNRGPFGLKVVNPDSIKAGDYEVWIDAKASYTGSPKAPSAVYTPDSLSGAKPDSSTWFIRNISTGDTVFADGTLETYNEKYLRKYGQFDWGLSGATEQQVRPGDKPIVGNNGLIESTVLYDDLNKAWLSGVKDREGKSRLNWIRSGADYDATADASYPCQLTDFDNVSNTSLLNRDITGKYENVIEGTFAPYNLVSTDRSNECAFGLQYGAGNAGADRNIANRLQEVNSIDIVFTSDKSKWSRCPVIEMTDNATISVAEGKAWKYNIRQHAGWNGDVDAAGNPIYSTNDADNGMSWFPGYAVNLETGERLNIYFGEESRNRLDNGADMIFNPTDVETDPISFGNRWGGKHIIYVSRTKYDQGQAFANFIKVPTNSFTNPDYRTAYLNMMWVGAPMLLTGARFLPLRDGLIPTRTRVSIKVSRPYAKYTPEPGQTLRNNGWPLYTFSTRDLTPAMIGDSRNTYTDNKDDVMKRIHVVPNPYYAISEYEGNRLESKVKIINLPQQAIIRIYTLDGTLIKTINKNNSNSNYVDWDIRNEKGIPVASGMYLVHVNLPGIGETVLKWFGAMRPIDIVTF
jgi:hypothetical protein